MPFADRALKLQRVLASRSRQAMQIATQAVASVNNLLLTLTVGLVEPLTGLGRFNLVFTVYISALGLNRAMVVEPMLVGRIRATYPGAQRVVLASSTAVAAVLGLVAWAFRDGLLLVLAASLPLLLLLDLTRYKHLRTGSPQITLCMDISWTLILGSAWVLRPPSAEGVLTLWASGGLFALIIGLFWDGFMKWKSGDVRSFFGTAKGISVPSALESLIFQFAWQLPFAVVLGVLSLAVAGEYRVAVTLMAPVGVIVASWTLSSYTKLRDERPGSSKVYGLALKIGLICSLSLIAALLFRENIGLLLFHSKDAVSPTVLLLTGLQMPILAFGSQLAVWFKVQRMVKMVLASRCISSFFVLSFILAGLYWNISSLVIASLPAGMFVHVLVLVIIRQRLLRGTSLVVGSTLQADVVR